MYLLLKTVHVSCVLLSYGLFSWRGSLPLRGRAIPRWLRVVPHWIDSVLLLSAISLAWLTAQYPVRDDWLTAKVLALLLYIAPGWWTLKRAQSWWARCASWLVAQGLFVWIVLTALGRHPYGF